MARMSPPILWPLFLQVIHLISFSSSLPTGNETDRLSLLAFKAQITNDPLGKLNSWNESLHFCEWSGVTCGRRHQRVVELDLHSCKLAGTLSPHIGNLSFLRLLNLVDNILSHSIPQELGGLFRLQMMILANNTFDGEIPVNISQCSNLLTLRLEVNNLTGKLPAELGSLTKMQLFNFGKNNLVGELPHSFANLSSFVTIYGIMNNLQGSIPNSFGKLERLKYLSLAVNNLSGTIPPSIYNLSSLIIFSVPVNQLKGNLPLDLGLTLPNLEILRIHTNQFTGIIPATLSNASKVADIQLSGNSFTGKVPSLASLLNLRTLIVDFNDLGNSEDDDLGFLYSLTNQTNLESLSINDNSLGGVLPEIVSNFSTKLRRITFGRNQIRGSIPTDIGNLISLEILALEMNQLTGIIPSSIGKLQNLAALHLFENKISGSIPSSLGNITSLIKVFLSVNNLQGSIPSTLGNCQNLLSLDLAHNNLSGPIPKEVMGISSLSIYLDLSQNQLTGPLSTKVGELVNLGYLDVSHNRLSGEIPGNLGRCITLENLDLGGNYFQGSIPELLRSLRALQYLNLSHNNLTGQIPRFLAGFELLQYLDLSFNDLQGEMPTQRVFGNASAVSVLGNNKLCGGISQLNLSRCIPNSSKRQKSSTKQMLIIAIPCGFLGFFFMIACLVFCCLKITKNKPSSEASREFSFWRVTYKELFQATARFSSSNLISAGSFGSVYKGVLASDGAIVAVKVFNLLSKGASESFMRECAALINIRHRNLVRVLSACDGVDFHGNDFKALVYEFMVNGSLEEWLHPVPIPEEAHEARNLNLIQRLSISIDVASALDYLHHGCQMPVVHCDLKPSNVLLDCDMNARVGDFGLARFSPEASHQLASDQTSSVGLKGTVGYAPPEYGIERKVSTYGDVYSYGIQLLEMFTGKRPTNDMFHDGWNLHNYAKMSLPDSVVEVVDPILLREVEETSVDASSNKTDIGIQKILQCLTSIIKIGVSCCVELPRERMEISNVVTELHRIRDILIRTRRRGQHEIISLPEGVYI